MKRKASINIGTSGWSYKHWKEIFYPAAVKQKDWLQFYAQQFSSTEINTSFYHLPYEKTVSGWKNKVPGNFKFCPKMSRYLTHMKKLNDAETILHSFFNSFAPLKRRLGPILVQLPPSSKFHYSKAAAFYKVCREQFAYYRFAMEVRHDSWLNDESIQLMKKYKIAFVIAQSGVGFPYQTFITAPDVYIRFHGPAALYASGYTDKQLQDFYQQFKRWSNAGHTVWAFFNNDINGFAFKNAKQLLQLVEHDEYGFTQ